MNVPPTFAQDVGAPLTRGFATWPTWRPRMAAALVVADVQQHANGDDLDVLPTRKWVRPKARRVAQAKWRLSASGENASADSARNLLIPWSL